MRIPKEMITFIAGKLAKIIVEKQLVEVRTSMEKLKTSIDRMITEDLLVEDRLNMEVREILKNYSNTMDKKNIDYSRMFHLVKNKLIKERNLII